MTERRVSATKRRVALLVAVGFLIGGLVGVAVDRMWTSPTEGSAITSADPFLNDEWGRGCVVGFREGWNHALSGRPYDPTFPDIGDSEYLVFMDGYVWGYEHGWSDGTAYLNYESGNHPIDWCSEQNRP